MDVDQRRARREARRRELTRRRTRGLAAVALVSVIAIGAIVVLSSGGSSKAGSHDSFATSSAATSRTATPHRGGGGRIGAHTSGASGSSITGTAGTATGTPGHEAVPILMYHVINPPPPGAKFPGLYVTPEEFSAQMHALAAAGFHAVTMDQMRANWTRGTPLPAGRPIVVSFDNGYQSQYTQALPVLHQLGWVGVENMQLTGLPPSQGGLSEAQISRLVAAGWELDTQGISHADLITLSPAALHQQVAVAREEVRRRYHVPVNWFCYPSGHYNAGVLAEVRAAGYVGSTTVVPGWATPSEDPYRLPRLRVLGGTSPQSLLAELTAIRSDPAPPASYGGGE
jgi:peptidoglycan/xylan/chitin deacetylase (PgdA/CDA1 family)